MMAKLRAYCAMIIDYGNRLVKGFLKINPFIAINDLPFDFLKSYAQIPVYVFGHINIGIKLIVSCPCCDIAFNESNKL